MYRFETKLKSAEDRGIEFSEGQKTYLRCARINGIDLLDHLYERYTQEYMIHQKEEGSAEYLSVIGIILSISELQMSTWMRRALMRRSFIRKGRIGMMTFVNHTTG